MIGIVDSHTFLWMAETPGQLGPEATAFVHDPGCKLLLSLASIWELALKEAKGKLEFNIPIRELVDRWEQNGGLLLPITLPHIYRSVGLPSIHRDPFDRMLVAQTLVEGGKLLSDDSDIRQYPVPVIW